MHFSMYLNDLRTVRTKLMPLVPLKAFKPDKFRYLRFDFTKRGKTDAAIVVTVMNNESAVAMAFIGLDYDGPDNTTIYVPPFKLPAEVPKGINILFTVTDDVQFVTIDFGITKLTRHLYQANQEEHFLWSHILPTDEIKFTAFYDPKVLERAMKTLSAGMLARLDFYSSGRAVISQGNDAVAYTLPIRASEEQQNQISALLTDLKENH